jgi:hypothetical protein
LLDLKLKVNKIILCSELAESREVTAVRMQIRHYSLLKGDYQWHNCHSTFKYQTSSGASGFREQEIMLIA